MHNRILGWNDWCNTNYYRKAKLNTKTIVNVLLFVPAVIGLGIVIFNNLIQATYYLYYLLVSLFSSLIYTLLIKIESKNKIITT